MNIKLPEDMSSQESAQERRRNMSEYISIKDIAKALMEPPNQPAKHYLERIEALRRAVSRQRSEEL